MGIGFKRREPINPSRVYDNTEIVEFFQKCDWMGYFEGHKGFYDEVSMDFSLYFQDIHD